MPAFLDLINKKRNGATEGVRTLGLRFTKPPLLNGLFLKDYR